MRRPSQRQTSDAAPERSTLHTIIPHAVYTGSASFSPGRMDTDCAPKAGEREAKGSAMEKGTPRRTQATGAGEEGPSRARTTKLQGRLLTDCERLAPSRDYQFRIIHLLRRCTILPRNRVYDTSWREHDSSLCLLPSKLCFKDGKSFGRAVFQWTLRDNVLLRSSLASRSSTLEFSTC